MGNRSKKRKHAQLDSSLATREQSSNQFGVASTLAHLHHGDAQLIESSPQSEHEDEANEWQLVDRHRKKQKKERDHTEKKVARQTPKGNVPALTYAEFYKIQSSLKVRDLQSLVLYCLADGVSPQWISVRHHAQVRKAVVLMVPGLEKGMFTGRVKLDSVALQDDLRISSSAAPDKVHSAPEKSAASSATGPEKSSYKCPEDYLPISLVKESLPDSLKTMANLFDHVWPVMAPGDDKYYQVHSPLHAMLTSPIPKSQEDKREEKKNKGAKPFREGKSWENKPTPITAWIASNDDLRENEYAVHPSCFAEEQERVEELKRRQRAGQTEEQGWTDSLVEKLKDGEVPAAEIEKNDLTVGRTVLAMDCEMCKVEGGDLALTRISIVDWNGAVVMDDLVKPDRPIVDYLTPYSGITAVKLDPISTTLSNIQVRLRTILNPRTIIVGHSLNSDLTALKLTHPFIVDTSILYQHPRGPPLKSSLKWLAQKYINREIQKGHGEMGHDSIEDARACLDLVKMKCEKGPAWGTSEANGESIFKRLSRTPKSGSSTISALASDGKSGAIVDQGSLDRNFGAMAKFCVSCSNDDEVVDGVKKAVLGEADGSVIPGGGVDFVWARLRELADLRGWLNNNRQAKEQIDNEASQSVPGEDRKVELSSAGLSQAVNRVAEQIKAIHDSLPPCTLFVIYSGTGDPREVSRLQQMQRIFKKEYATKKWDELSVRWTDLEEQALRKACRIAREGIGFMKVT